MLELSPPRRTWSGSRAGRSCIAHEGGSRTFRHQGGPGAAPEPKEDLERFATKEDLERLPSREELHRFATKEDLERFATKEDLAQYPTKVEIACLEKRMFRLWAASTVTLATLIISMPFVAG